MNDFTVYLKYNGTFVEVPVSNVTYNRDAFSPQNVSIDVPAPYCTTYRDATDIKLGDICQVKISNVEHGRESSTFSGNFFNENSRSYVFAVNYINDSYYTVSYVLNRYASGVGNCTVTGDIPDKSMMPGTLPRGTIFEIFNYIASSVIFEPLFHYSTTSGDVFQFGTFKNTTPLYISDYTSLQNQVPYENALITQTSRATQEKTMVLAEQKPTTNGETEDPTMYQTHSQESETGSVAWQAPFTSTTSSTYPSTGTDLAKWLQGCPIYIGDQDMFFANATLGEFTWGFSYSSIYENNYYYKRSHGWYEYTDDDRKDWTDYLEIANNRRITKACGVGVKMRRGLLHKGRIFFLPVDSRGSIHLTTDKDKCKSCAPDFRTSYGVTRGKEEKHLDYLQCYYYSENIQGIEILDQYGESASSPFNSGTKIDKERDAYMTDTETGDKWAEQSESDHSQSEQFSDARSETEYLDPDDTQFNFNQLASTIGLKIDITLNESDSTEYWRTRGAIDLTEDPSNFSGLFSTKEICFVYLITECSISVPSSSEKIHRTQEIRKGYRLRSTGEWYGTESYTPYDNTISHTLNVPSNLKSIWQDAVDSCLSKVLTKEQDGVFKSLTVSDYYMPSSSILSEFVYCYATFKNYNLALVQETLDGVTPLTYTKNLTVTTTEHTKEGKTYYTYSYSPISYIHADGLKLNPNFNAKATYDTGELGYHKRFCNYYQQNGRISVEGEVWKNMGCKTSYGKEDCKWDHINEPEPGTYSFDTLSLMNATYQNCIIGIGMYGSMVMDLSSYSQRTSVTSAQKSYPVVIKGRAAKNPYKEIKIGDEETKLLSVSSDAWYSEIDNEFAEKIMSFSLYNSGYCTFSIEVPLDTIDNFDDIFSPKEYNGVLKNTSIDFSSRMISYEFSKDE